MYTCIYLNLWKKEVDEQGNLLWEFAEKSFKKAESENSIIYYLGYLLKEIMFIFDEKQFIDKLELFNYSPRFIRVTLNKEEYEEAQRLKNMINSNINFFDILHILLARKTNSVIVTRDRELMEFAKRINVQTKEPEDIL
jgi:hypothetical protein